MIERIRFESLKDKVTTAEEAVKLIKDGMVVDLVALPRPATAKWYYRLWQTELEKSKLK